MGCLINFYDRRMRLSWYGRRAKLNTYKEKKTEVLWLKTQGGHK